MRKTIPCLVLALALLLGSCSVLSTPQQTVPPTTLATEPPVPTTVSTQPTTAPTEPPLDPDALKLDIQSITLWAAGMSRPLYTGTLPAGEVTFSSQDPAIATFRDGVLTAVGPGYTTVTAAYGSTQVSCAVNCVFPAPEETDAEPAEPTVPMTNPALTDPAPLDANREPVRAVPETFEGPATFFDDAAFIGDSVSLALRNYCARTGELGNALFLVKGSYGVTNAVYSVLLLDYQGQAMTPEDALAASGVKKVFIMLGMNDIAAYKLSVTMDRWGTLISRIREKCPDIQIYIQSMTPVWTGGEIGDLNNYRVNTYNALLRQFAVDNSCYYVDIFSYMVDGTGGLPTRYCSDYYVHLSDEGAKTWVNALKCYGGY